MNYEPLLTFYANTLFIEKAFNVRGGGINYNVCVDLNPPHVTETKLQTGTETWTTFHLNIFLIQYFSFFV